MDILKSVRAAERVISGLLVCGGGSFGPKHSANDNAQSCAPEIDKDISNGGVAIGEKRLQVFATTAHNEPERKDPHDFMPRTYHGPKEQVGQNRKYRDVQSFVRSQM